MAKKSTLIRLPNPKNLNPQILLDGEWIRALDFVDRFGPSVLEGYYIGTKKFSNIVLRIVKRAIRTGNPPGNTHWEPLSEYTKKRYGDHNIYYLTGSYYKSIGYYRYKNSTIVGLPLNSKARSSSGGISLSILTRILEYGTGGMGGGKQGGTIPPRPLWNPTFKEAGGLTRLNKEILTGIRQTLYKNFKIRPNQVKW